MLHEQKILDYWKKNDINKKSLAQNAGSKSYIFYDGPPFATGLPHYGHLLSSIAKDIIPRYWRMKGYSVPARWGWDCHGLPIEEIVERKLKISGKKEIEKIGIEKFNETCRESVLAFTKEWESFIGRIGRFIDFDNSYKTMDNDYIESVWWGLKKIYEKGLVYEGKKILMYCPRCETPVSNFEIAMDNSYKDITEESIFVKFLIKENKIFEVDKPVYFIAWTTTPWTLPSNMALAISEKINYCLIKKDNDYYLVAEFFANKLKEDDFKLIKKLKSKELIGMKYNSLYSLKSEEDFSNTYQVYSGDFVVEGEGTGIVHIAPMHGEDDFNLGIKNNLPIFSLLDEQGRFNNLAPTFLENIAISDANKLIKKDLVEKNFLFKRESTTHSCPICWRCSSRLFYYAIPSWFINTQKDKKRLLELNQKIDWTPGHVKKGRFGKGLESAPDWNISRNRYWASPIPLWKCQNDDCDHQDFIGSKSDILEKKFTTNNYFFMRHAECIGNSKDILSSAPERFNNFLTEKGILQAKASAKELAKEKIDFIIASPLVRTKETAEIVAKEIGYPIEKIEYSSQLREIDMGILSGKSIIDWYKFFDTRLKNIDSNSKEHYLNKYKTKIPEGESYLDVAHRFFGCIKVVDKKHKNKNILVISHGAPLKAIENIFSGGYDIDQKNVFKNAEIKKIDFKILPYNKDFEIDFHRPYIDKVKFLCSKCGSKMERIKEVIDCWVESASMPFAELHYPFKNEEKFKNRFPADYISEYISQTRAWFYVMHTLNGILFDNLSFKNCLCTGIILNEKGEKMSKSKKNFPDPNLMINKYGADSLRIYLSSSPLFKAENLFFSERELKDNYKIISLLYNILSFYNNYAFKIDENVSKALENESEEIRGENHNSEQSEQSGQSKINSLIDAWLLLKINKLLIENDVAFKNCDIILVSRNIKNFASDFSWYLRVSRERLKKEKEQGIIIFKYILLKLSKIIAPVIPFLAEEIYLQVSDKHLESVHLEKWPTLDAGFIKDSQQNQRIEIIIEQTKRIITATLDQREKNKIKIRQPLSLLRVQTLTISIMNENELIEIIKKETNVKEVIFDPSLSKETTDITKVEIDTTITEELKNEGILREFTRVIQQLRKEKKLTPKDNIEIYFYAEKEFTELVMGKIENLILLKEKDNLKEIKINEKNIFLKIKKIN